MATRNKKPSFQFDRSNPPRTEYYGRNPDGSKFPVYFVSDEELESRITEVNDNRQ